ncbi:hypothetical protein ENBRE01_1924 [Enteropsectra breve]|nr:hypothetical protein ENBRE01_1924 [Enteropsectra breve]
MLFFHFKAPMSDFLPKVSTLDEEHQFFSNHLKNVASFILSNKDLKAWLLATDYSEFVNIKAFKIIIKMLDDGVKYNNLTEEEQDAVKLLNNYIIKFDENILMSDKIKTIIMPPKISSENQLETPFGDMNITTNTTVRWPSKNTSKEETHKALYLNTDLYPADTNSTGIVDFAIRTVYENDSCGICGDCCYNEIVLNGFSANKYFILRIILSSDFGSKTVEFKKKYLIKSVEGQLFLPDEYEIASLLYIVEYYDEKRPYASLYCDSQPHVFKTIESEDDDDIYREVYLMLRRVSSNAD